jgi:prepilin-type N-terminal cleavage/methylation domain-containing protein
VNPTPSTSSADHRGADGFTLLELLLAIVILGLLLATVYGALSRTTFSKQIAEDRAELYSDGRQAVLRMAGDIEGALPPPSGDRIYFRGSGSSGKGPSIEFVATNRGGFGLNRVRPGRVLIAYSLDPLNGQQGAFALRREEYFYPAMLAEADGLELPTPSEGEDPAPTAQATYLLDCPNVADDLNLPGSCTRVTSLRFRYYDEAVRDWRDDWDSTQDATLNRIPAAVEIALLVADKDGNEHDFGTIVDLPLSRGQPTASPGQAPVVGASPAAPTPVR